MEIDLLLFGLLVVFTGEIVIYLKFNYFIRQLNNIVTMRGELENLTKLMSKVCSAEFSRQDNIFFKKELSITAKQQFSKVDVKLDTSSAPENPPH